MDATGESIAVNHIFLYQDRLMCQEPCIQNQLPYNTAMNRHACVLILFCFLAVLFAPMRTAGCAPESAPAPAAPEGEKEPVSLRWTSFGEGLELGLAELPESLATRTRAVFAVVRITPERHSFTLSMASESGTPLALAQWSRQHNLRAGINASMYLPDKVTSTGYMRNGVSVNNGKMGERLGAFFVAGANDARIAPVDIIEKSVSGWRERLNAYRVVVQNYRFISGGELLWPAGGPMRSIAVVAKDTGGRILFILCQEPLTVTRFAEVLTGFSLDLGPVMYVEGGVQAGLFVRIDGDAPPLPGATTHAVPGGMVHVWKGRTALLNARGDPEAPLPNVLGVAMGTPEKEGAHKRGGEGRPARTTIAARAAGMAVSGPVHAGPSETSRMEEGAKMRGLSFWVANP